MAENEAQAWVHIFNSAVYGFPILGAIVADAFLGKYRTILSVSIIYCLGHLALALDDTPVEHRLSTCLTEDFHYGADL